MASATELIDEMERMWKAITDCPPAPSFILCNTRFLRAMLRTVIRRRGKTFVIYPGLSDARISGRLMQAPMPPQRPRP